MKKEVSAGGVVVRKIQGTWHVLLMKDMNNTWTFPKGIIEENESSRRTAEREIAEEVGLTNITFVKRLGSIGYYYRRNGLIKKIVTYYLFESPGNKEPVPQREEGIDAAAFVPFAKALSIVGYKMTNKPLLTHVEHIIQSL